MRASRGLKWENKMYKPKRSIARDYVSGVKQHCASTFAGLQKGYFPFLAPNDSRECFLGDSLAS